MPDTEQVKMTQALVAQHLREHAKKEQVRTGCLICVAWDWARSLNGHSDSEIDAMLASTRVVVEIQQ